MDCDPNSIEEEQAKCGRSRLLLHVQARVCGRLGEPLALMETSVCAVPACALSSEELERPLGYELGTLLGDEVAGTWN